MVARRSTPHILLITALGLLLCLSGCRSSSQSPPASSSQSSAAAAGGSKEGTTQTAPPAEGAQPAAVPAATGTRVPAKATGAAAPTEADRALVNSIPFVERVTGGASADASLPLVVGIHGLGDRPERFVGMLASWSGKARVVVPQGFAAYSNGFSWFDISGGKQSDTRGQRIYAAADRLAPWIAAVSRVRPTQGKPVVTGFSQGGMLSFALALRHPRLISGAIPLAGAIPAVSLPESPPDLGAGPAPRILALHGDADDRVPLEGARGAVERMASWGWNAELIPFAGVKHRVPQPVRSRLFATLDAWMNEAPAK